MRFTRVLQQCELFGASSGMENRRDDSKAGKAKTAKMAKQNDLGFLVLLV